MKVSLINKLFAFSVVFFFYNMSIAQEASADVSEDSISLLIDSANENIAYEIEGKKDVSAFTANDDFGLIQKNDIKIYPNPVIDDLNVSLAEDEKVLGKITYKISDLTGRVLGRKVSSEKNQEFHLNRLASGVYIMEVNTGNKVYTKKITKK